MKRRITFTLVAAGLVLSAAAAREAEAIPAFSRQYKTECTTCHTIIPERNEFGDAFEKNSFVWPKGAQPPAQGEEKPQPAAPGSAKVEALLNSGLHETFPLSVLAQHDMKYNRDKDQELDFDAKNELEIFAAGNFRDMAAFFAEYKLEDDESEVGEIWVQFRNPFDLPVNVKGGKIKPKLSLWKSSDRVTISKYGLNNWNLGEELVVGDEQGGIEVNSVITPRLFAAAGVTDGSDEKEDEDGKDWYGHISYRVGGTDFLGNEPEVDLDRDSVWDYLTLTFGSFYYAGTSDNDKNDFFRAGLESEIIYQRLKVRLGGYYGEDDEPAAGAEKEKMRLAISQAEYLVGSNFMPSFRFEYEDLDAKGVSRRYIPSFAYTPFQNLKLALEYLHDDAQKDKREATFRIAFAF